MPNFAPNSIIYLGNVPFDNSYRHTMTFANATAQAQYFSSVCNRALDNSSYTYVRMNNSIRVPFNAEELYTYDYCMYKNANYGNKWFYAFIVGVNYVNENMTEIVLELDVMQTWYFDYTLVQGFVEREHVNDDTIGAHLNSEPVMDLQYDIKVGDLRKDFPAYVIMLVTAFPNYKYDIAVGTQLTNFNAIIGEESYNSIVKDDGNNAISGGIVQRQYTACIPLLYDLHDSASVRTLKNDIQLYNICGCADAIVDMFTVPERAVGSNWMQTTAVYFNEDEENGYIVSTMPQGEILHDAGTLMQFSNGTQQNFTIKRGRIPEGVDVYKTFETIQWDSPFDYGDFSYVPYNNKLYSYPYCYAEIGDFTGRKTDYRFEYFKSFPDEPGFKRVFFDVQEPINSEGIGYITPRNYNGGNVYALDTESINCIPFTFSYSNKLPWTYSVYQNWMAQNQLVNELAVIGGIATTALSVMPGISAASKALGAGMTFSDAVFGSMRELGASQTMLNAKGGFFQNANIPGAGIGAGAVAGVAGNIDRMSRMPNEARGNTSGNSKIQCGYQGYYTAKVYLKYEFMKIADDFFSMYGYAIDRVKIPNRTGRRNWNYVKMQNSCHRGNVPADQMDMINKIYDNGITFWHTSDVGNYSLDNSII